ncbi:MAG: hypothetical protein ABEK03_10185 [Candidatus Bipolaricaulia bacterium]
MEPDRTPDRVQEAPLDRMQEGISKDALPKVLASSVIRSAHRGESHGGLYLVDLATGNDRQLLSWDDPSISWKGRGGDRGLRGIAFHDGLVYIAASDEIFVFDSSFKLIDSFTNPYLKHCHEIDVYDGRLYLTSTGFDSILEVDLDTHRFLRGFSFRMSRVRYAASRVPRHLSMQTTRIVPRPNVFNPESKSGPSSGDQLHINSVFVDEGGMYVSGRKTGCLLQIDISSSVDEQVPPYIPTPFGTHNVLPMRHGDLDKKVIMNDTKRDVILVVGERGQTREQWPIPRYDEESLERNDLPEDHARQAFGRGLKVWNDFIIVGSSPATITAYAHSRSDPITSVNLTLDVRNAIHGLEVWPFT